MDKRDKLDNVKGTGGCEQLGPCRTGNQGKSPSLAPRWFVFDYYFSLVIFWVLEEAAGFILHPSSP